MGVFRRNGEVSGTAAEWRKPPDAAALGMAIGGSPADQNAPLPHVATSYVQDEAIQMASARIAALDETVARLSGIVSALMAEIAAMAIDKEALAAAWANEREVWLKSVCARPEPTPPESNPFQEFRRGPFW